jgi:RHS repeat-associated protein
MWAVSRARAVLSLLLFGFSLTTTTTLAQQPGDGDQNLPPFGSFSGSDFDIVSLQNGNLHISIPLIDVSQRGGKTLSYSYIFDTPDYQLVFHPPTKPGQVGTYNIAKDPYYSGWRLTNTSNWMLGELPPATVKCDNNQQTDTVTNVFLIDPNGGKHGVALNLVAGGVGHCVTDLAQGPDWDGLGVLVNLPNIITRDGTKFSGTLNEDTNGNEWTGTADTLERNILTQTLGPTVQFTTPLGKTTANSPQYLTLSYLDSNGARQQYRIDYEGIDTDIELCITTCPGDGPGSAIVPKDLILPTGASYQFQWVNASYAQLQEIVLPTGGSTSYTYALSRAGSGLLGPNTEICRMSVQSRTVTSGGTSEKWTYGNSGFTTTVTDPNSNQTVHTWGTVTVNSISSLNAVEKEVDYYSGSSSGGNLLKKVVNTYTGERSPIGGPYLINLRIIQQDTTLDNGAVRRTQTDYETFQAVACNPTGAGCPSFTATRMNPTAVREYDYGSGSPGPLLRTTSYAYLHNTNTAYVAPNIVDRVTTMTISNGGATQVAQTQYAYDNYSHAGQPMQASGAVQHDSNFSTAYTLRGNVTSASLWRNTDGALLTTTKQYDDAGNVLSSIDPLGNKTTFAFTDSWGNAACVPSGGNAAAYPTKATNALNQTTLTMFNSCTGTRASMRDPNSQTTGYTYDLLGRPTVIRFPDGGQISNSYNDTQAPLSVTSTTAITSSLNKTTVALYDGLGRLSQTQLTSDPDGTTYTVAIYDALGRTGTVYSPTRCNPPTTNCGEPTWGSTSYAYDALDRIKQVTQPDGSIIQTSYSGNSTTVTDEAGVKHESVVDGLSRLTAVFEDPGNLNYQTAYTYDALNNLTSVVQNGSRNRTFVYDSLSHLTGSTNPESNTVPSTGSTVATTYAYDADGNLINKIMPAQNQTGSAMVTLTYCFDALNRMTAKAYTSQTCTNGSMPSPVATYSYDQTASNGLTIASGIGRRTGMKDAAGSEAWSYDVMGRVLSDQRTTNGVTKDTAYLYLPYVDGSTYKVTYPSGFVIQLQTGGAERLLSAVNPTLGADFVTGAHYAPQGAPSSLQNGTSMVSTMFYNDRLQPCRISVRSTGASPASCTDVANIGNEIDYTYGFALGTADNGRVVSIRNNGFPNRSQSFTYDTLNRITSATTSATHATDPTDCWGETYFYDNQTSAGGAWGSLTSIGVASTAYNGCTQESLSQSANIANRLSGLSYDTAGNVTFDGVNTYIYNAENQLTSAAGVTYTYDGDGKRVEKSNGKLYWYGTQNDALMETDLSGNLTNQYVFFGGRRIARSDASGNIVYYMSDHLGTSRVLTNATGGILDRSDFYPFGGERVLSSTTGNTYKFSGKERDFESNLDNFGARYDSSSIGRFMSPDPGGFSPGDPQSWNRYTYVLNNPLTYIDPDGAQPQQMQAVHTLGKASLGLYVQQSRHLDVGALLASLNSGRFLSYQTSVGRGQSPYVPTIPNSGSGDDSGGCLLGCAYYYDQTAIGLTLQLTFSWDDNGEIKSANVTYDVDKNASFLEPDPRPGKLEVTTIPGGLGFHPAFISTTISGPALASLTNAELNALAVEAVNNQSNPIFKAILDAIIEERKRREREAREKALEKRHCGSSCTPPGQAPAKTPQ